MGRYCAVVVSQLTLGVSSGHCPGGRAADTCSILLQQTAVPVACYGNTDHVIRKLPFCPDKGAGYLPACATRPQQLHISRLSSMVSATVYTSEQLTAVMTHVGYRRSNGTVFYGEEAKSAPTVLRPSRQLKG